MTNDHVPIAEPDHVDSIATPSETDAAPGDVLEVQGIPGAPTRRGTITEVIGEGVHRHYRVRWDEEHESLFYPSTQEGMTIIRASRPE